MCRYCLGPCSHTGDDDRLEWRETDGWVTDAESAKSWDRRLMTEALAEAERDHGPLPEVDWETPEELSRLSMESFARSRDGSSASTDARRNSTQNASQGRPRTTRPPTPQEARKLHFPTNRDGGDRP